MTSTDRVALHQVLDALWATKRDGPWEPDIGICDNVEGLLCDEDGDAMPGCAAWVCHRKQAFEQWDKYSGVSEFPVHDTSAPGTPTMQYMDHHETSTLWEGVQGELRQDLLDHLIKYFTDRLEEASA